MLLETPFHLRTATLCHHRRWRRETASKDRDVCRTRKSRLHDVSSAHPGLSKRKLN